jgi:selenocysteine lyase/cysteine desulfurase
VICEASHDANRLPWTTGDVRDWKMDASSGELSLAALRQLVDEKTKIVAVPHASNVTGLVYDVRSVVACVRSIAPDALIVVDGVAYAAHRRIEFSKLGADAYVVATHKAFGPHAAALCCSAKLSACLADHAPNAVRRPFWRDDPILNDRVPPR